MSEGGRFNTVYLGRFHCRQFRGLHNDIAHFLLDDDGEILLVMPDGRQLKEKRLKPRYESAEEALRTIKKHPEGRRFYKEVKHG